MLLQNLDEGHSDMTKFQENMLNISTCPRFQQGAFDFDGMQNSEANRDEHTGVFQTRYLS